MQTIHTISKDYNIISLEEIKHNLQILSGDTYNDIYINNLMKVAVDYVESKIGDICLTNKQLTISNYRFGNEIIINDSRVIDVTGITITDNDSNTFTIDSALYWLECGESSSIVHLSNHYSQLKKVVVNYSTGFVANTPARYKQAIIIKASDLFDSERSNYVYNVQNNRTIERLLNIVE